MVAEPIVKLLFVGRRKAGYEPSKSLGALTNSQTIKRYPYVADSSKPEMDLLPVGKEMLLRIRGCKTAKAIDAICIGPKSIVIHFALGYGNPYGTNHSTEKKVADEKVALEALNRMDVTETLVLNAQ